MNKRLWIVLGVIVVVFFGGLMWYNSTIKEEPVVDYSYVDELDGSKMITKEDVIAAVEKTENRTMTDEEKDNIIRIGTSPMTPANMKPDNFIH